MKNSNMLNSGTILKAEPAGLADELDIESEKEDMKDS
jgi:hypothetical protein